MGMLDGMFSGGMGGGFSPQMPTDLGMPMAINQQGQNGQGLFGMMGGQGGGAQQGGGLLGMNFGGNQPIADIGGQGQGLLGFGSPGQGRMNPMMRMGMNMMQPGQQQMQGIQPQGRYMGNQWMPFNMDNMAMPNVRQPRDANTYNPADIMSARGFGSRQERI